MANSIFRTVAKRLYTIFGGFVIGSAALLLSLKFLIIHYQPSEHQLITLVQKYSPVPLSIRSAKIDFVGWEPRLQLEDVEVLTPHQTMAFKVDHASGRINPFSLLINKVELSEVQLDGAKVGITYYKDGTIVLDDITNMSWSLPRGNTSKKRFTFRHFIIRNSDIHLHSETGQSLPLAEVECYLDSGFRMQATGHAVILSPAPSKIDFSLQLPFWSQSATQLYVRWQNGQVAQIADWFEIHSPVLPKSGKADVSLWLELYKSKDNVLMSEFSFNDIVLSHHDNICLEPISVKGWLQAKGKDQNWQLSAQWQTPDRLIPYEVKLSSSTYNNLSLLDLKTWEWEPQRLADWLGRFDLFSDDMATLLSDYSVTGMLDSLSLQLVQEKQQWRPLNAEIGFSRLSLVSPKNNIQLSTFDGGVIYHHDEIACFIESKQMEIVYPNWFARPIDLKDWELSFCLSTQNISPDTFSLLGSASSGQASMLPFTAMFSFEKSPLREPTLEFSMEGGEWPIQNALTVLPRKIMSQGLVDWLDQALSKGTIAHSDFVFRGDPSQFPFDNQEGIFSSHLQLRDVTLDYKSGDWPELRNIFGVLSFQNRSMSVDVQSASLEGGLVRYATAKIDNLGSSVPMLHIESQLENQLHVANEVVQKSPLKHSIGKSLSIFEWNGLFSMDLALSIPLSQRTNVPVKVLGTLNVADAAVVMPDWQLTANNLNGVVHFTENQLNVNELQGSMFDFPTRFTISTQNEKDDRTFLIDIHGKLHTSHLQSWIKMEEYPWLTGESAYRAKIGVPSDVNKHPIHIELKAPLTELAIELPKPFQKEPHETREMEVLLDFQPNQSIVMNMQYDSIMNLALWMDSKDDKWIFKGGHIHLGQYVPIPQRQDGVLLIDGRISEFNLSEWRGALTHTQGTSSAFEPLVHIKMDKFTIFNESFAKTLVEARWDNQSNAWNVNLNGPSIKGHLSLPLGEDRREMSIHLAKLSISNLGDEIQKDFELKQEEWVRPIDLKIEKLKIKKKVFTQVQAKIEPSWKGFDIPKLSVKCNGTEVNLNGHWDVFGHDKAISAEGKIITRNSTDTLKIAGISGTVHQAKGTIDFSLSWHGLPTKIDYSTLTGKASFSLNNGYVQGVDPGIGRVLNLLSLDTVQRRLNLDFNDITKKGLAFDEFSGRFSFGKGKMSTNKIVLRGPSAEIEGYGQSDLFNQEISGELTVVPNVTGSLPVAVAIAAGNPAVGAAVWIVDKMVGKKLQAIHRYRYKLVGTWVAPKLEELPSASVTARNAQR